MALDTEYRGIEIKRDDCCLCDRTDVLCLRFDDNEGYSHERVCKQCMEEAIRRIIQLA